MLLLKIGPKVPSGPLQPYVGARRRVAIGHPKLLVKSKKGQNLFILNQIYLIANKTHDKIDIFAIKSRQRFY